MTTQEETFRSSVTVQAAAKMLALTEQTIYAYIKKGRLESFTLPGGQYRVFTSSIAKLMNGGSGA